MSLPLRVEYLNQQKKINKKKRKEKTNLRHHPAIHPLIVSSKP